MSTSVKDLVNKNKRERRLLQINTSVDDPKQSINELMKAGVTTYNQRNNHFERKKNIGLPNSLYSYPKNTCKSRGSSVGHSREGSSDDGFGSSGRQTLSPASISSSNVQNYNPHYTTSQPINVVNQRQASAPELINYSDSPHGHPNSSAGSIHHATMHSHHHLPPHGRFEPRNHPSGLPPVAHSYSSKSLSTAALASATHAPNPYSGHNTMNAGDSAHNQPHVHRHRTAKSCDFEAISNAAATANQQDMGMKANECYAQSNSQVGGSMHQVNTFASPPTSSTNYWADPRGKSQSLDPLAVDKAILWQISQAYELSSYGIYDSQKLKRLRAGPIVKDVLERAQQKIDGHLPDQKMYAYSGHDTSIASFLVGLGIKFPVFPLHSTALMIELHKDPRDETHFLRIFYRNDTKNDDIYELDIPNCEQPCKFESISQQLHATLIPNNWLAECNLIPNDADAFPYLLFIFILVCIAVILAFSIVCLQFYQINNSVSFPKNPSNA